MKTVIFCSGSINDYKYCEDILRTADYIICADGGTRHTYRMSVMPDIIIGDMDSSEKTYIDYYILRGVEFRKHPADKDKTDTELCLEYAMEFSDEIVLLGATGSRLDHTLANISLLRLGLEKNIRMSVVDSNNQVFLIDKSIELTGQPGELFSLLPISEKVEGLYTYGAHYELADATIELGSSYGVSNYFKSNKVRISIESGLLLVIKSID